MKLSLLVILSLVLSGAASYAAQARTGGKSAKSSSAKGAPAKAPSRAAATKGRPGATGQTSATKQSSLRSAAVRRGARTPAQRPRRYQLPPQPTPERYKEIQTALAGKGYFQGAIDGVWGPDSQDALKRFQKDQNLTSDGKLSSLSIIAMGLGAPHGSVPSQETPVPPTVTPEN